MQLGPYELVRKLGVGGMAEVWVARRGSVGGASKSFAVKRLARHLADEADYRDMFLSEARLSMLLSHSNIVQVFDAGEDDGEAYLAMELVDGLDLSELGARLRETGERLSTIAAGYIVAEILTALAYAHDLRDHDGAQVTVVHRDISPHNVMLSISGEVKLMDFGIARLQSEETGGTHIKGKVRYMPPEQLRGDSREPTVDLFAVGAVLHELLDGERFRVQAGDEARLFGMVLDGEVPEPRHADDIPPELEVLRQRLLAEDVEDRIQTAREALECLYRWPGYRNAKLEISALVRRLRGVEAPTTGGTATLPRPEGALTELVSPVFDDGPGTSRTRILPADEGHKSETSDTSVLSGHGGEALGDNPATERRAKAEGDETEALARDSTSRATRAGSSDITPEPARARGFGRVGAVVLGAGLALAAAGITGAQLGWFDGLRGQEPQPEASKPEQTPAPIDDTRHARILGNSFSGYAGFRSEGMKNLAKLDIQYSYRDEPDSSARLAALGSGEAEFALVSLDRVLLDRPAGKIVALVDLSTGCDALVLNTVQHPELTELAALPDMLGHGDERPVLAYAGGTPSEYFAQRLDATLAALERNHLEISDDYATVAAVWAALEDPQTPVALGVLWEPWVSKARKAGMTVAVSTLDFPHAVIDVLVASDAVLERDPELVDEVVLTYYRQAIAQHRDPRRRSQQLVRESGLDAEDIERVMGNICVLTPLGAEPWFVPQPAPGQDQAPTALLDTSIRHVWATLALDGRTQGRLGEVGSYYDARAVVAAAADTRGLLADSGMSAVGIESTCLDSQAQPGTGREGPDARSELGPLEFPRISAANQAWFEADKATVAIELDVLLGELVSLLAELNPATVTVRVVGFGDAAGGKGRRLGLRRAKAFAALLEASGVAVTLELDGRPPAADTPARRLELELVRQRRQ